MFHSLFVRNIYRYYIVSFWYYLRQGSFFLRNTKDSVMTPLPFKFSFDWSLHHEYFKFANKIAKISFLFEVL